MNFGNRMINKKWCKERKLEQQPNYGTIVLCGQGKKNKSLFFLN
jgi:hypothetical protein